MMNQINDEANKNYIIDAIKKIDKMQKEILLDKCSSCVTCETSLITMAYNTIPITLYTCNGFLSALASSSGIEESHLFRVECVRGDRFATLRLLTNLAEETICSDQTITIDLNCIFGIECFEPINCNECAQAWKNPFSEGFFIF